jgi:predicted house-cleaning noncanonical NTP pyrophosphatase (MazG superfamily)
MKYRHTKTNLKIEKEYPKLVRDKIPEIIEKDLGRLPKMRILRKDSEMKKYLLRKVVEEAVELNEAKNKNHIAEEMADVLEIFDAILKMTKMNMKTVRKIQKEKAKKRGGFEKRVLLEKI